MRHFLYKEYVAGAPRGDGGIGMISIPDASLMYRVPVGAVVVGPPAVPEDKSGTYFEAWRLGDDGEVTVDLGKAKEIRLEYLRKRREKTLKELDKAQFRAYCAGDEDAIKRIEKTKDGLRDFPERIDWDSVTELRHVQHVFPPELV